MAKSEIPAKRGRPSKNDAFKIPSLPKMEIEKAKVTQDMSPPNPPPTPDFKKEDPWRYPSIYDSSSSSETSQEKGSVKQKVKEWEYPSIYDSDEEMHAPMKRKKSEEEDPPTLKKQKKLPMSKRNLELKQKLLARGLKLMKVNGPTDEELSKIKREPSPGDRKPIFPRNPAETPKQKSVTPPVETPKKKKMMMMSTPETPKKKKMMMSTPETPRKARPSHPPPDPPKKVEEWSLKKPKEEEENPKKPRKEENPKKLKKEESPKKPDVAVISTHNLLPKQVFMFTLCQRCYIETHVNSKINPATGDQITLLTMCPNCVSRNNNMMRAM